MIHAKKSKFDGLEVKNSGKFPARRLLVPILFTMIFLVSLLVVVTQFSENAEAGPYGVQVSVVPPKDKFMETTVTPQSVLFSIDVENTGVNLENVYLNSTFNDPQKETAGWTVNPKFYMVNNLGGGAIATVQIQVTAPESAPANTFAQITVKGTVKEDPTEISSDTLIARVKPKYNVKIEIKNNDNAKNADQGSSVTYNLNISNTGNIDDTYTLSASGLPPGEWKATFSPSNPTVSRNATRTDVTVTLKVPTPAKNTVYPIDIVATSKGDTSVSDSTSTFTTVNPKYQLSISVVPKATQTDLPGEDVDYIMTVENIGNTDDLVTPGWQRLGGLTWDVFLDKGVQTIPYQSNETWTLTVSIPSNAKDWERGNVMFNVTSTDPSGYNEMLTITKVGQVYGVDVFLPANKKEADPGETISYQVEITNRGNTNDTIKIFPTGEFTPVIFPNRLFDLPPDTPTYVTLNVTVTSGALSGLHYITVTGESENDPAKTNGTDTAIVDVQPLYEVDLQQSGGSYKSGKPGGSPVLFQLRVVNDGTDEDEIDLSRGGQKPNWASLSSTSVTVPAKSYVFVDVTVTIPSGESINVWFVNITGQSIKNSTKVDMQSFQIEVEQIYDVQLSSDDNSKSVPAGGSILYYINVKNTGSGTDDFSFIAWAISEEARTWASATPFTVKLASGQNATIQMLIEVDEDALPDTYNIQLNCTSDNDTWKKVYITHTVVSDRYEVAIAGAKELTEEAPEDVNVTYVIEIFNFGTGTDTFDISVSGDRTGWVDLGTNLISNLPSGGHYNLTVTVKIEDANDPAIADGMHNLKLIVTSRDDPSTPKSSDYVWLNTSLTETRDASLNPQQDVLNAEPGDTIYFNIMITNTGSTIDTFELEDDGPYKGWGTILNPTVTLSKDQSTNITYQVDVHPDVTRAESPVELYIWAKSLGKNEEVVENLTLQVNVNKTFGVKIFTTQNELEDDPGEFVVFIIEIKNEGNDVDDIILSHQGTELGVWGSNRVPLQPGESAFVNYTVDIESDHDTTDIVIILNASSDGDDTDQTYMTLPITVHVNPRYEVFLSTQQSQKKVRGGENVTFSLAINNRGTDVDIYDLRAVGTYDWWATINPSDPTNTTVVVDADQTKYVDILVSPPEGQDTMIYDIIINVTSQNDNTIIELFTFFANVEATYDVFIYPGNPHDKVPAGDTATFTIFVENKGNADDQYNFFDVGLQPGWTISINPDTINVPAGDTKNIQVSVTTSQGSASGAYNFTITSTSINDPTKESTTKLIVEVEQVYDVDITAAIAQKSVDIDDYIIYEVEVKNSGNGEDIFELSLSGTYAYWATLYYNQTVQGDIIHISPPPGGSLSVDLNVSLPSRSAWETAGSPVTLQITIEAESILDPDATPASAIKQFTTTVNEIYEVSLSVTSSSRSGIPGDTVSFSITIYNDGTKQDDFNIEIVEFSTVIPNVTIGIWDDENPGPFNPSPPITISDGGSQVVTMDITIPSPVNLKEVPTGDYYILVKVTSKGKSTVWANWTFTVKVKQLYSAWITDSILPQGVDVGTSASYQLQVQNKGNKEDTITFEIVDDPNIPGDQASWADILLNGQPITSIFLSASESRYIYLNISVPGRGDPGYPSVDPTSLDLKVKVKPSEPGEPGAVEDELQVTTNINPIYSFDLTSMSPQDTKEADAGDQISFTLQVRNAGTVSDTFNFRASNFDDTTFSIGTIMGINDLSPDSYDTTLVGISIDADADIGSYVIEITVESNKDPSVKRTINLTVDITGPIYTFELRTPAPLNTMEGKPDQGIEFTLEVRNTGTDTDSYNFRVTKWDTSIFTVPDPSPITNIDEDTYGTTKAAVTITKNKDKALVGSYEIEVTATSDSDPAFSQVITLIVDITAEAEVELTPPSQTDTGDPEDTIDYTIEISNKGNAEDIFDLSLEGTYKDWGEILDASGNPITQITLNATKLPGSFTDIILRVTIPGTGETKADQAYPITIKASSTNTEGVEDQAQISTTVGDFVDLELDYSGSGSTKKDYDPNKKTPKFSFRLTNNGNQPEQGIIVRVDPEDWAYSPENIGEEVEPGGTATFSLEFTIPDEETEGEYELTVYLVSSVDPSEESDPVYITINITKPDLTVGNVNMPTEDELKSRVDNQVTISATVSNEGHAKAESITVKLYVDGVSKATETISSIEAGGSRDVSFRWKVEADLLDIEVKVSEIEEIDTGNNAISPIYLDLRPDLQYEGEQLNFTNSKPDPGEKITIRALIKNTGGDAENVIVRFTYGTKTIGTDTLDIDYGETGEATFEDWTVPDKPGDSISIKATIDLEDALGDGEEASKSIKISGEVGGVAGVFTGSGLIGMGIGLIIGALLFLVIGLAIGRRGAAARREPEGMAGPSFAAFEKEMPEGAGKKAPKAPAPFERPEEEAPPEEEEKAKPKEIARVRCPKCGKVTEVTSTQRPLQIPCECGTTLMLKK